MELDLTQKKQLALELSTLYGYSAMYCYNLLEDNQWQLHYAKVEISVAEKSHQLPREAYLVIMNHSGAPSMLLQEQMIKELMIHTGLLYKNCLDHLISYRWELRRLLLDYYLSMKALAQVLIEKK